VTATLIITGLFLFFAYVITLHKNTVQTFIVGAVERWYQERDKTAHIEAKVAKDFMTSKAFQATKGITGILVIGWTVTCIWAGLWGFLIALPVGLVVAIIIVKATRLKFDARVAIHTYSKVVGRKRQTQVGQLTANDIANNTAKYQLSNLDFLLEDEHFLTFARKLKRAQTAKR
jgi:hypothetical protein